VLLVADWITGSLVRLFPPRRDCVAVAAALAGAALSPGRWRRTSSFSAAHLTDRGHVLVSAGPYHWIRDPGYAVGYRHAAIPAAGLAWGLVPAVLTAVAIAIRTAREDRMPAGAGYQAPPGPSVRRSGVW
jgi:protein-S-isoprenylcysteine O-methyltransferase Ste14